MTADSRSLNEADDAAGASQRVAMFERSGDPSHLWPGLSERARVAAARELERLTREVLAGRPADVADGIDALSLIHI